MSKKLIPIRPPEECLLGSLEDWDDAVFMQAHIFKVVLWRKGSQEFDSFADAVKLAYGNDMTLLYAVTPSGRSCCLVRDKWEHYAQLWIAKREGARKYAR